MIEPIYLSKEASCNLESLGFNELSDRFYWRNPNKHQEDIQITPVPVKSNGLLIAAPRRDIVEDFLLQVKGLHISVDCIGKENWRPVIQKVDSPKDIIVDGPVPKVGGKGFDSRQEAFEAAIKYIKENLI